MELVRGNRNADVRATRMPTIESGKVRNFCIQPLPRVSPQRDQCQMVPQHPKFAAISSHATMDFIYYIYHTSKVALLSASGSRIINGAVDCEGTLGLKPCSESILSGGAEHCACRR